MQPYGNPKQPVPKRSRRNPTEEEDSDEDIALWNATSQARNIQSSSAGYVIRLNGRIITPAGSFPDPDLHARAREERVQQEVERVQQEVERLTRFNQDMERQAREYEERRNNEAVQASLERLRRTRLSRLVPFLVEESDQGDTDSEKSTIPDADFLDLTVEDDDDDWEVPVHMENPWPDVPEHDDDDIWI